MGLAQTDTGSKAQEKFWGSLLKKYGPTAARLAGHAIKAYMGLAQTSSSAQEKFWGSLLKKYGPTAARLAGHAIKAYMGLAQTSTTAVEKEKFLFAALAAAKLGYTAYKMFSLPQVANFKKAEHYTAYKMFSLTQTNTATAAQTKWGFGSLLKKYGPTAARLAGKAISAYMGLSQTSKGTIKSRIGKLLKKSSPK